jgi:hypothetical protein
MSAFSRTLRVTRRITMSNVAREQLQTLREQAARWWADFLRHEFTHETGDFETTTYANHFANKKDEQFSAAEAAAFEDALCDILQDEDRPIIYTEYDPGPLLQQAADQAGIDIGMYSFPVKTEMTIERHEIYVVPGGGAQERTLDEWYQEVNDDE